MATSPNVLSTIVWCVRWVSDRTPSHLCLLRLSAASYCRRAYPAVIWQLYEGRANENGTQQGNHNTVAGILNLVALICFKCLCPVIGELVLDTAVEYCGDETSVIHSVRSIVAVFERTTRQNKRRQRSYECRRTRVVCHSLRGMVRCRTGDCDYTRAQRVPMLAIVGEPIDELLHWWLSTRQEALSRRVKFRLLIFPQYGTQYRRPKLICSALLFLAHTASCQSPCGGTFSTITNPWEASLAMFSKGFLVRRLLVMESAPLLMGEPDSTAFAQCSSVTCR